jgi:hypothetical protein
MPQLTNNTTFELTNPLEMLQKIEPVDSPDFKDYIDLKFMKKRKKRCPSDVRSIPAHPPTHTSLRRAGRARSQPASQPEQPRGQYHWATRGGKVLGEGGSK